MIEPIRRDVVVRIPPEEAFALWTERLDTWWPMETHSRAADEHEGEDITVTRIEFERRAGGRVLEHQSTGDVVPWAEVLEYDPPRGFVLAWRPNATTNPPTELVLRFSPHDGGTRVELEHRGWERLGAGAEDKRAGYAMGWEPVIERFERSVLEVA